MPNIKDSMRLRIPDIPVKSLRSAVENMIFLIQNISDHEGGDILSSFNATFLFDIYKAY